MTDITFWDLLDQLYTTRSRAPILERMQRMTRSKGYTKFSDWHTSPENVVPIRPDPVLKEEFDKYRESGYCFTEITDINVMEFWRSNEYKKKSQLSEKQENTVMAMRHYFEKYMERMKKA